MEKLNLKKQERDFLTLNRLILTIVFMIISLVLTVAFIFTPSEWWQFGLIVLAIWTLYLLIFIYQGLEYKHFSYAMSDVGLFINQGVFWRKKIIVPLNRVQHTDVLQGPLERKFDLAELIIHTAGTRSASVKLPGISHQHAEILRESLAFAESNDAV